MHIFIVNPIAGSGNSKAAVPIIEKTMKSAGVRYSFIYTEKPDDFARVNARINELAGAQPVDSIVCVGGDGTAQEYLKAAIDRGVPFGIIPAGSANDFLYSIPGAAKKFRSFEDKISYYTEKIIRGETKRIDAVSLNGENCFINIGGTGIDIQVLIDAIPLKKYLAGGAYFISLIKNAVTYKDEKFKLTIDGKEESGEYLLLAICNGSFYGGHLRVAPTAVADDGMLTLCVATKMPRLKRAAVFPLVKPGWHNRLNEVSFINCESFILEFDGAKIINLDGNLKEFRSPLKFDILKGAVRFIV